MNRRSPPASQYGVTLMEVLVTVLVLAIGLLGLASLQLNALRTNTMAYERTQATILAYEIVDRMRTNRDIALAGGYDIALGAWPDTPPDCLTLTCGPAGLALFDLDQWKADVAAFLPSGDAAVATNGSIATITLQWTGDRAAGTDTQFTMSTVP